MVELGWTWGDCGGCGGIGAERGGIGAGVVELGPTRWRWMRGDCGGCSGIGAERGGIGAGVVELGPTRWNWGGRGGIAAGVVELRCDVASQNRVARVDADGGCGTNLRHRVPIWRGMGKVG